MRKQSGTTSQNTLPKSTTTTAASTKRQGDWVCMMCHNLNYSFRQTCNRCKNVTREQNITLAKNQKERQPLGELPLNRHSSYKEEIHHSMLDGDYNHYFMSHSKKEMLREIETGFVVNEFLVGQTMNVSSRGQGFGSLLFLTPNRYMNVKDDDQTEQGEEIDNRSPCGLSAVSPLLRALKDEINCQY